MTVERKEGVVSTPAGRRAFIIDLPGTYSLRARSPDEEVTRDVVLGRFAGEAAPDVLICVADATNLRLVMRLVLELKQTGRPLILALNMFDIAQRQGLEIDLDGLSARARRADRHHRRGAQARARQSPRSGRSHRAARPPRRIGANRTRAKSATRTAKRRG